MKNEELKLNIIARIYNDFPAKFGLPRQSGLAPELMSEIVFEPAYRNDSALKGITQYSHLWLIWGFSEVEQEGWSPTVRPPRLGGNTRIGVFATRSPYRPNPIGLTCVKLESINKTENRGVVLTVSGADIMSGSPIYDIKPYIPYADSHPEATGGFSEQGREHKLKVEFPDKLIGIIPEDKRAMLFSVLEGDPRPAYQSDSERVYGFCCAGYNIKFTVDGDKLTVTAVDIIE